MSSTNERLTTKQRLALTTFRVDGKPHIEVRTEICDRCEEKYCLYVCPANLYTLSEDGKIQYTYEGCLECGACRLVCPKNGIKWDYPKGGFGVYYRYG